MEKKYYEEISLLKNRINALEAYIFEKVITNQETNLVIKIFKIIIIPVLYHFKTKYLYVFGLKLFSFFLNVKNLGQANKRFMHSTNGLRGLHKYKIQTKR